MVPEVQLREYPRVVLGDPRLRFGLDAVLPGGDQVELDAACVCISCVLLVMYFVLYDECACVYVD